MTSNFTLGSRCDLHRRACLPTPVRTPTLVSLPACWRTSFQSQELTGATHGRELAIKHRQSAQSVAADVRLLLKDARAPRPRAAP